MSLRGKLTAICAMPALLAGLVVPAGPAVADSGGSEQTVDVNVTIPDPGTLKVTDAQFRWGVNAEMTSGAFFGGCNFLSAGEAGDAGSSRVWEEQDGLYRAKDGNTRIETPGADGTWVPDSWDTRCLDSSGREVGTDMDESGTGAQVVIEQGSGSVDTAKGTASISWDGAFSLVMYGGMTYWSLSDPVLTVANGKGRITATATGYGADMVDSSKWTKLGETTITMAELPQVALAQDGIVATPAYKGVAINGLGDTEQVRSGDWWGSFPESWVEFNVKTGQAGYWYSTGGLRDPAKAPTDVYISYSALNPVEQQPPTAPPKTGFQEEAGANPQESDDDSSGAGPLIRGTILQQAAGALASPLTELAGTGTSVLEAATVATSAINWLGKSLIPDAIERAKDYRQPLLWSLAGLLALASVAWVGFRRGWLVWPFASKQKDQKTDS